MSHFGPLVRTIGVSFHTTPPVGLLSGILPGPAGSSSLELASGRVVLDVDTPDPANLVALSFEDVGDLDGGMESLLGPTILTDIHLAWDRAAAPAIASGGWLGGDQVVIWRAPEDPPASVDRGLLRGRDRFPGALAEVGRLALAASELARERPHTTRKGLVTGLGSLEVAHLARAHEKALAPVLDHRELAASAVGALGDLDDDALVGLDPAALDVLRSRVAGWSLGGADLLSRIGRWIEVAAASAEGAWDPEAAADPRATGLERPFDSALDHETEATEPIDLARSNPRKRSPVQDAKPAGPRADDVDVLVSPPLMDEVRVIAARFEDRHLTVHVGGSERGDLWLRVFEPARIRKPLALVPFNGASDHHLRWRTAIAPIPDDRASRSLLVDVTATPGERWENLRSRQLRHALDLGIRAARCDRLGDVHAAHLWGACAVAWHDLGQQDRAERAVDLAEQAQARDLSSPVGGGPHPGSARPGIEPLVTDLIPDD